MPIDSLIVASRTPIRWRTSAGTPECVMVAGCDARDSVPPRLTASLKIFNAFRNRNEAGWPPWISKENVEPAPLHWAANVLPTAEIGIAVWKVMDCLDLGMLLQEIRHRLGIAVGPLHADL